MNDMKDNMNDLSCHEKENQMRLNVYDVYDFIFGRDSYSLAFDNEMHGFFAFAVLAEDMLTFSNGLTI